MSEDHLFSKIDEVHEHLSALWGRAKQTSRDKQLIEEALEELSTSLEELRATAIELNEKNEALAVAHVQLDQEQARYKELFEFAPDGYIVTDDVGTILEANQMAATMLGVKQKFLIGKPLSVFWDMNGQSTFSEVIDRMRQSDAHILHGIEFVFNPRKGKSFPASTSIGRVHFRAGAETLLPPSKGSRPGENEPADKLYLRWILRDISELKRLYRTNIELERFAFVAAHQLQEPCRVVSNYTGLLVKEHGDALNGEAIEFMSFISSATDRMSALVRDLLTYCQVESEKIEYEPVDCNLVVELALENLEELVQERKARISTAKLPTINANKIQLTCLFQNLIENAVKFGNGKTPQVRIAAQKKADAWIFSVTDNGIGIDKKYQGQLFKMFSRLHKHSKYPGTGMGLAICKKIVEQHGGEIWVESDSDQGARFQFTLPTSHRA